ncbi:MAG: ABC transporter ATP-binding protein [Deferribacteraceae bacterium]|jgi:lipoprotein-releasing system ATP-binding protein|nr:ABC transporter ATP-binding protein [Deferribacteraceae bacterium]
MIEIKNISKSFSMGQYSIEALREFSMEIKEGELIAITGSSGVGKSTLMHIIGGLERPSAGEVMFRGKNIYGFNSAELDRYRNGNVGFVFQFHYLLDDFTALENVTIPALLAGKDKKEAQARAGELLETVGLKERVAHYPKELSGGEQQRVAVARALMNNPTIIMADEPTGNLDRSNSLAVQELLFNLKNTGISVVIVTHDTELSERCDRIIKLEKV